MEHHRGRAALRFGLTTLRVLVGVLFVNSGLAKVGAHAETVADFGRWGVPMPDLAVSAVGGLEMVGGALLVLGVATSWVALPLLATMAVAIVTAGRTDGGGHLVLPPVLGLLCALFALRGGGGWQLLSVSPLRPSGLRARRASPPRAAGGNA